MIKINSMLWLPPALGAGISCEVLRRGSPPYSEDEWEILRVERDGLIGFPRHFLPAWQAVAATPGAAVVDETTMGRPVKWDLNVPLRSYQEQACATVLQKLKDGNWGGVLQAPCGAGKTVCLLHIGSKLGVSALIVVHTEELLKQWRDEIAVKTSVHRDDIGVIQGDRCEIKDITVAMVQTLSAREFPPEVYQAFGLLVSEEVHRAPAPEWGKILSQFPARYRVGLTATPVRSDKAENIFLWHIGPILYEVPEQDFRADPVVCFVPVSYFYDRLRYCQWYKDEYDNWQNDQDKPVLTKLEKLMANNPDRNEMIASEILAAAKAGRRILAVSKRTDQLEWLHKRLIGLGQDAVLYTRKHSGSAEKRKMLQDHQILLATSKIATEGLNIPELDTLVFCLPVGGKLVTEQMTGRILRALPDKKRPVIVDFVDTEIDLCKGFAVNRMRFYTSRGWDVRHVQ